MKIGYMRTNRQEPNTDMQLAALKKFGPEKLFEDKYSVRDATQPRLQALLEFVRAGDVVYAESMGRLARSAVGFLEVASQLAVRGVGLVCLKESFDSATPEGAHAMGLFQAVLGLEREAAKDRRQEGIDAALVKGKAYGRPKIEITENFVSIYKRWKAGEITAVQAMQESGLKKNTFYNRVKEIEQAGVFKKLTWGIRIN